MKSINDTLQSIISGQDRTITSQNLIPRDRKWSEISCSFDSPIGNIIKRKIKDILSYDGLLDMSPDPRLQKTRHKKSKNKETLFLYKVNHSQERKDNKNALSNRRTIINKSALSTKHHEKSDQTSDHTHDDQYTTDTDCLCTRNTRWERLSYLPRTLNNIRRLCPIHLRSTQQHTCFVNPRIKSRETNTTKAVPTRSIDNQQYQRSRTRFSTTDE